MKYNKITKEALTKIVEDVFKDYKDPTIGMSLKDKVFFDKAFKAEVNKLK